MWLSIYFATTASKSSNFGSPRSIWIIRCIISWNNLSAALFSVLIGLLKTAQINIDCVGGINDVASVAATNNPDTVLFESLVRFRYSNCSVRGCRAWSEGRISNTVEHVPAKVLDHA